MSDPHVLLQTDIVDSTRIAEQLGDEAWAALSEAHDVAARDLLPKWRGREIDKSDGFLLLFSSVDDAVDYALEYHRALAALDHPIAARAGIHRGLLRLRDIAEDYVARGAKKVEIEGLAKPLTARVMAIAGGGQTLLTAAARSVLDSTSKCDLRSHGFWRIKGLVEPFELYEVGAPGALFLPPVDAPKGYRVVRRGELWLPRREVRHSLPSERDSFVGRHEAMAHLALRFEEGARLVCILGVGGAGKTRLAKRYGWTWLGDFPGGVWFCDLAQARTVDGIAYALGQGLDVPLSGSDPVGQLASAIAGRGSCLVILDNFEQVARQAEATLGRWLDRAMDARFIVTSREALGIVGEEVMVLDPLPSDEGASLFLQRAAAARSGYVPTADDRATVEPLVRLLDGLPLAIELAAARVRVMSPRMLLARMSERFKLLASNGGRPDRQSTLRATLDWSWELLSEAEKSALSQLSVFEGGFTLEAAEAVVDLSACGTPGPWVPDVVQALVEKCLVRPLSDHRLDLLVTVQAYAADQLSLITGAPADAISTIRRHWRWFDEVDEQSAVANGCVESENLVSACRRASANGVVALGALRNAWAALKLRGPFRVAVELAQQAVKVPGLASAERAWVHFVAGEALRLSGEGTIALRHLESALRASEESAEQSIRARTLCAIAEHRSATGQADAALEHLSAALELAAHISDRALQCQILNDFGAVYSFTGRANDAQIHYERALEIARQLGDRRWEGGILGNIGTLCSEQGRFGEAELHYERALALARQTGDRRWEGNAACNLGMVYLEQRRFAEAQKQFETALLVSEQLGNTRLRCAVLCNLGLASEADKNQSAALRHYAEAVSAAAALGDRRSEGQFRRYLGQLQSRAGHHEAARECLATGERLLVEASDPVNLATLLCAMAENELSAGDTALAARLVLRARNLVVADSIGSDSELDRALHSAEELLRRAEKLAPNATNATC